MRTGTGDLLTCDESSFLEDSEHVFFAVLHGGKRMTSRQFTANLCYFHPLAEIWGAHAPRVLVLASRQNNLFFLFRPQLAEASTNEKFVIARTRSPGRRGDRSPSHLFHGYALGEISRFIDIAAQFDG